MQVRLMTAACVYSIDAALCNTEGQHFRTKQHPQLSRSCDGGASCTHLCLQQVILQFSVGGLDAAYFLLGVLGCSLCRQPCGLVAVTSSNTATNQMCIESARIRVVAMAEHLLASDV